jgi:Rieske Fe-S protein
MIIRREFCAAAATCAMAGALGCGRSATPSADAAVDADLGGGQPDAPGGGACPGGGSYVDVGAPDSFVMGTPKYFSAQSLFVVRDAGGLYAVSAICTHRGCTVITSSGNFYCPCHGARFTYDGATISGPVSQPLVHYAMCALDNGNVGVDPSTTTDPATRL